MVAHRKKGQWRNRGMTDEDVPSDFPLKDRDRPKTRAECRKGIRPCPFVGCRHHLYLEVKSNGKIVLNHPGKEPWELDETCALDIAEREQVGQSHALGTGPREGAQRNCETSLEVIGQLLGMSRERARQVEELAKEKIERRWELGAWSKRVALRASPDAKPELSKAAVRRALVEAIQAHPGIELDGGVVRLHVLNPKGLGPIRCEVDLWVDGKLEVLGRVRVGLDGVREG